jgi:hypothetical protein
MPPSPGVTAYTIYAEFAPGCLYYTAEFDIEPWVYEWVRMLEPWQIWHRSRVAAIASAKLQVNEVNHRLDQAAKYEPVIAKHTMTDQQSSEIYHLLLDKTEEYMKFNPSHITQYISDHKLSGMGGGPKWIDAYPVDMDVWYSHYNILLDNIDLLRRSEGKYNTDDFYNGIRARGNRYDQSILRYFGLEGKVHQSGMWHVGEGDQVYLHWGLSKHPNLAVSGKLTRSRMVRFIPRWSQYTVHLIQKAAWYHDVLWEVVDIVDAGGVEWLFPYDLGGKVYLKAAELHQEGYDSEAVDGSSWDTSVGTGMGRPFTPFFSYFRRPTDPRGYFFLDSGITFTSMLGTIYNVYTNRNESGTIIAFGDDMTHFWTEKGRSIEKPFAERDRGDTEYKYMLGLAYAPDPEVPRLSGWKTTMDRAGKMSAVHGLVTPEEQFMTYWQEYEDQDKKDRVDKGRGYKRARETRVAWAGAYLGQFGKGTLLDAISKTKPGDFVAPGQLVEELIVRGAEIDPFRWAEERGLKTMFL